MISDFMSKLPQRKLFQKPSKLIMDYWVSPPYILRQKCVGQILTQESNKHGRPMIHGIRMIQ